MKKLLPLLAIFTLVLVMSGAASVYYDSMEEVHKSVSTPAMKHHYYYQSRWQSSDPHYVSYDQYPRSSGYDKDYGRYQHTYKSYPNPSYYKGRYHRYYYKEYPPFYDDYPFYYSADYVEYKEYKKQSYYRYVKEKETRYPQSSSGKEYYYVSEEYQGNSKFPRKTSYDEVKKGYPHSPYIKKYPYPHREYKRVEPTKHYNYYDLYDSPQEYDRGYHQPYDGYPFN
ncbi:hypothetical protein J4421_02755 [Candidatus Woesearchaeota archaeon]|nr:hypothetical protein [Candidatus Woesearchaeota archaeon]